MKKLHFEKKAAEAVIALNEKYIEAINEFGEELAAEGITLTNDILEKFTHEGQEYIGQLMVDKTIEQYNKAGIQVNSIMLASLQQNASAVSSRFDKYRMMITNQQVGVGHGTDQVNITDEGKAVFTETEKRNIIQAHTVYLKKEDEELFNKLEVLAETLNRVESEIKEAGEGSFFDNLTMSLTENPKVLDHNQQLQFRGDILFILTSEGALEVNPAYFNR